MEIFPPMTLFITNNMTKFIPIIVIIVVIAIATEFLKALSKKGKKKQSFPYQSCGELFTQAERSFLAVLEQAVDDSMKIYGKVRLADVIKTKSGLSASERGAAFNRIKSKHLDFVICDANDLSIKYAVELDDKSHGEKKRKERDKFLNQAMAVAEIPLIRFPAKNSYSLDKIKESLSNK